MSQLIWFYFILTQGELKCVSSSDPWVYLCKQSYKQKQMELPIYISNIFHPQCQAKQCTDEFAQCLMQTAVRRRRRQLNKWIFFQLMTSNLDPERRASRKKNGQKNSLAWEFLKHIRNLSFTVFVYVLGNSSQPIEFFAVKKRFFGRSLCSRLFFSMIACIIFEAIFPFISKVVATTMVQKLYKKVLKNKRSLNFWNYL